MERLIASVAREANADEYCRYRRYADDGDLDGDGKDDFAVLFHVERRDSNRVDHWVAVFPSKSPGAPVTLLLAGADEFLPDQPSIERGRLVVTTLEYRERDPHCCPTGKGRVVLKLEKGKPVVESHTRDTE